LEADWETEEEIKPDETTLQFIEKIRKRFEQFSVCLLLLPLFFQFDKREKTKKQNPRKKNDQLILCTTHSNT
jgi:hypothetical protein